MNNRQNIRKAIIIGMFFLFPITITWISPAVPVIFVWLFGILPGAMIVFLFLFIASLFLGRAFCGFFCSVGGLQECLIPISQKKLISSKINIIKYIIWIIWVIFIIVAFAQYGRINKIDFFAGTIDNYMFFTAPYRYIIYFGMILFITVLNLIVGRRAFCNGVCIVAPFMIIGTKISDRLKLPKLRLKINQNSCIGCKQCSNKCPMSLDVKVMVETGNMKNSECILCGECIDICPKKSIAYTFKNLHIS